MGAYSDKRMKVGVVGTTILENMHVPGFRIMKEKAAVNIEIGRFRNSYLLRDASEVIDSFNSQKKLYPLHGFIGSDLISQVARRMNLSDQDWIEKEYLPKLSKKIAYQNFGLGISLHNHTQNTLIEIDPKTGEISDFVFKDIQDQMVDRYVFDKNANLNATRESSNILNHFFFDNSPLARTRGMEIGIHFALYDAQSIMALTQDPVLIKKFLGIFVRNYFMEVQNLTGRSLSLSVENANLLEDLENGFEVYPNESTYLSHAQSAVVQIMNDIYEQYMRSEFPDLSNESFKYNQVKLYEIFSDLTADHKTMRTSWRQPLSPKYGISGRRIIMYDSKSENVIAASTSLSDEVISSIAASASGATERFAAAKMTAIWMRNSLRELKQIFKNPPHSPTESP